MREKLLKKVQKTIEKHTMLRGVTKVLIAFSSGPDSVCLLDVLNTLYGHKIEFHLIYVNHGLRSQRVLKFEENLTKIYASNYAINYKITTIKVRKKKVGIEAAAREERYHRLLHYMKKIDAQRIVLGHNLDDVIETFLMNMLRGSGMRGLKSIPPVRLPFIRPLISVKKVDILRYLKKQKLSYSRDETNRRLNYRRNLLRHTIIPQFIKINPRLHETIQREIEILHQDDEYLETQAESVYKKAVTAGKNYAALDLKIILRYNQSIVSRVVMKAIKELRDDLKGYETKHFDEIIGLKDKENGKKFNLPKGLYAQKECGAIVIGRSRAVQPIRIAVKTKGEVFIPGKMVIRTHITPNFDLKNRKPRCEIFDLNKIKQPLFARTRVKGDGIITKIGRKSIKNVFNESNVPYRRRTDTMMFCDQKGILWVVGLVRASRGFIDKKTRKILVVEYENID
jgi:tRNA(Ile)-lysidine synthase